MAARSVHLVAVWLPIAIAVIITVMWIYWVIFGVRASNELHSG